MFTVNEDGSIVYNENLIDNGTLFSESVSVSGNQITDEQALEKIQIDFDILEQGSVSDGDPEIIQEQFSIIENNYYTVYATPSGAVGFPNSSSLSYLEDVVKAYPLDYSYVCYRTSDTYAQPMILFIGPDSDSSGNNLEIYDCDVIELVYNAGSGYNNYTITREMYHEDIASITLNSESLIYTNVVPGYASFDIDMQHNSNTGILSYILLGVILFVVLLRIIGGKN